VASSVRIEPKVLRIDDEAQTSLATLERQMHGHHHGLVEDSIEIAKESAAGDRQFRLVPHKHDALAACGCKLASKSGHVAARLHLAPDFDMAAPIGQASHQSDDLGRLNGANERARHDAERRLAHFHEQLGDRTDPLASSWRKGAILVFQTRGSILRRTVAYKVKLH